MEPTGKTWHVPVRPYSPIDAYNRRALATGSVRLAQLGSHADYNGHHVTVSWNSYRSYYIAEYFWAGRRVLARGSFEDCLRAALAEYNRGALGASVEVTARAGDEEAEQHAATVSELVDGSLWVRDDANGMSIKNGDWYTWRHKVAVRCAPDSAHPGTVSMLFDWELLQAADNVDTYTASIKAKHGRIYR